MADLIKKTDTLNQGREKLNAAIEHVDTFQRQIDEIVVEGDSSVEAAQARVEPDGTVNPTLKARLDKKETEFSAQLAQKATKEELLNKRDKSIPINQNDISDELRQQITGTTPINAVPAKGSITRER